MDFNSVRRVYFIGIGGIGMSALARYFVRQGIPVAGYDRTPSQLTRELEGEGIAIHYTDNIDLIPGIYKQAAEGSLVVYTPAVPNDHSELLFFRSNGYSVVKRAQALGVIASSRRTIAVAGTHGKTSTTTLIAHLLNQTRGGCDAFLGGISRNFNSNLVLNNRGSNLLVAEADEFDRSFLRLHPEVAVITSVDADHLDVYGTHDEVKGAFSQFSSQIEPGGMLILKAGVDLSPKLAPGVRVQKYNLNGPTDYYPSDVALTNGFYQFTLVTPYGNIERLNLGVPGRYNLENAVAASAVALSLGISEHELRAGLAGFSGVARRFDVQYRGQQAIYIDDYAHHPEELRAAITSARELFAGRRITGIFQPHLYTRTRDFAPGFAASLDLLDEVLLLDIYPAREEPIAGITSGTIKGYMRNPNCMILSKNELLQYLHDSRVDVLISMGAGDIDRLVPSITRILNERGL